MLVKTVVTVLLSLSTLVAAHTALNFPTPRGFKKDFAVQKASQDACENQNTNIPNENNFKRGQKIDVSWWWNNHKGGFIKFAVIKGIEKTNKNAPFLENKNIVGGQCYYFGCDDKGFDPGFTHLCKGKQLEIPNWLADGDYTFQFSQIGGFDSDGIPTKQLPLYHNCANIKVAGGVALEDQPKDWIAPFIGGDQFLKNGKPGTKDQCAFKQFDAEPADPALQDVNKGIKVDDIKFGGPGGWSAPGATNKKRGEFMTLSRMGRVTRGEVAVREDDHNDHDHDEDEE